MLEAMEDFCQNFKVGFNRYKMEPIDGSIADNELKRLSGKDEESQLKTAFSMGIQSIDYACDHLIGFLKCMEQPASVIAPFTCVRGLMESCAIARFLLEPEIGEMLRLERSFSFRREGQEQQMKLARATSRPEVIARAEASDSRLNETSKRLGFNQKTDRNKPNPRYGMKWPGITSLIGSALDQEPDYRILSAVAHGHHWANLQLFYEVKDHPIISGEKVVEKCFYPASFLYLGQISIQSLSMATYSLWELLGWDEDELKRAFDKFHSSVFNVLKEGE